MRQFYSDGGRQLEKLFAKAKAQGLTTSLDMTQVDRRSPAGQVDWPALLRRGLPLGDLFMPSLDEISFMLGHEAMPPSSPLLDKVADELLEMGSSIIALKLGDQGLYLRTSGDAQKLANAGAAAPKKDWIARQLLAPCFEVEVAGTTGAGDCTIAGFLAALLNGLSPEASMKVCGGGGRVLRRATGCNQRRPHLARTAAPAKPALAAQAHRYGNARLALERSVIALDRKRRYFGK